MTGRQQKAITELIRAPTVESAARAAGVGYSTVRRWLSSDPEFRSAYSAALAELLDDSVRDAKKAVGPAVGLLREVVEDRGRDDRLRIQAADRILTHAVKLIEQYDVLNRLNKLEQAIDGDGDDHEGY